MTSTLLTRRSMLSSGVFVGLGALLAACGQQANNEGAATASAAPSETASASAAASDTASASATPSPVITRGYSGGSKAPDGEYRKADGKGPAQNVPKPRNEPAQYPETEEGLNHMMEDWVNAHNYAIQTGDCSYAFKYITENTEEYGFYKYIEILYKNGGWAVDSLDSYQSESALFYDDSKKIYRMKVRRIWSTEIYIESNGDITRRANTDTSDDTFYFLYTYSDGYWKIINSKYEHEL
ncbi:hypothetical protein HMPREF2999_08455 [Rothia sp. HMSC066H02]|uniref:DUF6318 family protein n=1 Tax=unclassified Rothia (in: high G+C Gram-positive bacteria) TaxID=2689056 RepID=UPI0008A5A8D7|nr:MULTISPECIES: DUF6318 family protein [unclassified Rothia (in: high G+C Gram-positive bacteria)]OFO94957.1 hypothetical protein HMPREF3008_03020 [Rothia sp. HMSC065D09]OFP11415.1 hypothetical protein HMPREF2999_08455 [Rothia sp. HMSC066H02]